MPKPAPERLVAANYPELVEVQTRFQDLDPLGHINNVAMAALIESGRIGFNHRIWGSHPFRKGNRRWLLARLEINYIAEGHFPAPVMIGQGFGKIGTSSWDILSGVFQGEKCIATSDCTLVLTDENGAVAIDDAQRKLMERFVFSSK